MSTDVYIDFTPPAGDAAEPVTLRLGHAASVACERRGRYVYDLRHALGVLNDAVSVVRPWTGELVAAMCGEYARTIHPVIADVWAEPDWHRSDEAPRRALRISLEALEDGPTREIDADEWRDDFDARVGWSWRVRTD